MSQFEKLRKAAALKYSDLSEDGSPVVVASGMGSTARDIVRIAEKNGVPVFRDDSLATLLSRMDSGAKIPPELYRAVVDIYVYFLGFQQNADGSVSRRDAEPLPAHEENKAPSEQSQKEE